MNINRETSIAELKRRQQQELDTLNDRLDRLENIEDRLKDIMSETDVDNIALIVNKLLPWLTKNISVAEPTLQNSLAKKLSQNLTGTTTAKTKGNSYVTFLVLDGKRMQIEKPNLYKALIEKKGVKIMPSEQGYIVVHKKNYGAIFKHIVKNNGFENIPAAFQAYLIAQNNFDTDCTVDDAAKMKLSDFK